MGDLHSSDDNDYQGTFHVVGACPGYYGNIIGASLSEPHTDELNVCNPYIILSEARFYSWTTVELVWLQL